MANFLCAVSLTEAPLVTPLDDSPPETGAAVDFWGIVRGTENGNRIAGIEYEAHRAMAEHQLRAVATKAAARFELKQIRIEHRVGFVPVGQASLLVRVGSQHRAEALRATGWIVDELKKHVPIWKHPRSLPETPHHEGAVSVSRP